MNTRRHSAVTQSAPMTWKVIVLVLSVNGMSSFFMVDLCRLCLIFQTLQKQYIDLFRSIVPQNKMLYKVRTSIFFMDLIIRNLWHKNAKVDL